MRRIREILGWGLAALGAILLAGEGSAAEKVRFRMDWIIGGKHVAFFVARDKGLFQRAGMDVEIQKGDGSRGAAIAVDTRQAEYSYGDLMTTVQVLAKSPTLKAIGVGYAVNGVAYISLKGANIRTPKDLEGKRLGATPGDVGNVLLPAFAALNGFDHKKVNIEIMKEAVRTPALFEGKIDFISGVRGSSVPRMRILARRMGKEASYLYFKDWGFEAYGHVIQARSDTIANQQERTRKFVQAIFQAWDWSIKNPEGAAAILFKAHPELDKEINRAQVEDGLEDVQSLEAKEKGLGYMEEKKVKMTVDLVNTSFKLAPPVDYRTTYTNEFISKTPGM